MHRIAKTHREHGGRRRKEVKMSSVGNLLWLQLGSGDPKLIYTQYGQIRRKEHMGWPRMNIRSQSAPDGVAAW